MHTPIRIAYIDQTGEMGGAEHLLLTLLEGLPPETISPLLICAQEGPFLKEVRKRDIPAWIIPLPAFYPLSWVVNQRKILNPVAALWNLLSVLRGAWRIKRYLQAARVDLVQTNSALAHIYGGMAARWTGTPCIWYFHDLVESRRLAGTIALLWRILAACLATQVIGISEAVLQSLSIGSRGRVIYAGYRQQTLASNTRPDLRTQLALPSEARLVGYVGRIAYAKALDVLAQAARQIIQVEPRAHFVLLGEALFGETDYKRALEHTLEDMHLSGHWHWLGYDKQAASRMPEFDLLVLPSRREGLGLTLVEAGLAGVAAVGSQVGGIPEVIVDGETGLLVPPESPDELAAAILRLLQDPETARKMGQKANDRVKRIFDPQRYYVEFLELYASVLGRQADILCS